MTDDFLYLEEVDGLAALAWVKHENDLTQKAFTQTDCFKKIYKDVREVLFDTRRIPDITQYGKYVYNLWQDEQNPKGIWRRTTLEKYKLDFIDWEIVLDFDELGQKENINWFFGGCLCLEPEYKRCFICLEKDGSDAVQIREFNLQTKQFILDGFFIDTAKTCVNWINENEVYVMTNFGHDSLTLSGYPRIAKKWSRGTSIEDAVTVFEADRENLNIYVHYENDVGFEKGIVYKVIDFYEAEVYLLDNYQKLDVPLDAYVQFYKNWIFIQLNKDWEIDAKYLAGSLLVIDLDEFLLGSRNFKVLFQQTSVKILHSFIYTKDFIILNILKDVCNYLEILDINHDFKYVDAIKLEEQFSQIHIHTAEKGRNNVFMMVESFIAAESLYLLNLNTMTCELLKSNANKVSAEQYSVEQYFAHSADGTKIPYFQIAQKSAQESLRLTLMEGYGGFQFSLLPHFLEAQIPAWLSHGGVYVVANVRGGGEYGPVWHQQALKHNRQRAYEDFAAIAADLIGRGITSRKKLAAIGGSNGGLLMGNMLTHYAHLFGAIICEVPLLDMQRYSQIGAGYSWIAEYGDPNDEKEWQFLKQISPYHNLSESQVYPPVLFYTATSDDRVTPVHARKMVAKMKAMNIPNVYFYEQMEGGHSVFRNKELTAFHTALTSTFLFKVLGD